MYVCECIRVYTRMCTCLHLFCALTPWFLSFPPVDFVSLDTLKRALHSQDPRSTLNDVDGLVDVVQIVDVLVISFEKAEHKESINIAQSVDLVLNWLLNVFDR